jgi:predicted Rossmann-fold nucleotide-binding protein
MAGFSTVTVFADCGMTSHQAQYRHVGEAIARKKAHLICIACNGEWPRALIDSALAHGGKVTVCAADGTPLKLPRGVTVETAGDARDAGARAALLGQALVALPGGLGAVSALYNAWTDAGGSESGKPVGLLNRHGAFEVVRGFMTDIAAVGLGSVDQLVQVSDNFEDLWTRLARIIE